MHRCLPAVAALAVAAPVLALVPSMAQAAGKPALKVSRTVELNPNGQELTISGSGYSAGKNGGAGVYVVMGPHTPDWTTNSDIYQDAAWVSVAGLGGPPMHADGSFSGVTFTGIKARYEQADGRKIIDCYKVQCYIMTMAAHGSKDRSQDVFVPLTFKAGGKAVGTSVGGSVGRTPPPSPSVAPSVGTDSAAPSPTASVAPSPSPSVGTDSASPSPSASEPPAVTPLVEATRSSSHTGVAVGAAAVVALVFGAVGFVVLRRRSA